MEKDEFEKLQNNGYADFEKAINEEMDNLEENELNKNKHRCKSVEGNEEVEPIDHVDINGHIGNENIDNVLNIKPSPEWKVNNVPNAGDNIALSAAKQSNSSDKHVRFYVGQTQNSQTFLDLNLQSARSSETREVWETMPDRKADGASGYSNDSVFDRDSLVTDLDEEGGFLRGSNVFKTLLDERKKEKGLLGDGELSGYLSEDAGNFVTETGIFESDCERALGGLGGEKTKNQVEGRKYLQEVGEFSVDHMQKGNFKKDWDFSTSQQTSGKYLDEPTTEHDDLKVNWTQSREHEYPTGVSGYFSGKAGNLSAGEGGATHTCGALFGQCGAARGDRSLVTTYSHGRYGRSSQDLGRTEQAPGRTSEDLYSGPVSLNEILLDRDRMCRLMGNGASSNKNGVPPGLSSDARVEARRWEERAVELGAEVSGLAKELKRKDHEVLRLQREIHKLKSVLQQSSTLRPSSGDILSSLHGQSGHGMQLHKKQGVSAESSQAGQTATDIQIQRFDKDFRSKQVIKEAIMDNDFLKNLDLSQVRELVDSMYPRECPASSYLIREGEPGAHLYVSAEGEFEVIKEDKVLGKMGPGKAFGELAILYNCTRTASIRVVVDSRVWVLDRRVFQRIMMRTGLQRLEDNVNFLRSVPLFHNLNAEVLARISDVLEVEFYPTGHHIVRQGASGDTFYILSQGSVKVIQRILGCPDEQELRRLHRGDYFGEQALLKEDCRTASVVALAPGVECLTLDRESFIQLIGDLSELQEKEYGDLPRSDRPPSRTSLPAEIDQDVENLRLEDLDVIATLGVGGFGRVELVQSLRDKSKAYALKCLKKEHIVETHQQEHVYSEKDIMIGCRHAFICRLYKTFKDSKYVYMLLDACLGGEVWSILRDRGCFDDAAACFVCACVVEALDYLHCKAIVYRDLKPENLLLDTRGYVKLVDFGFAKRLGRTGAKTWTFCGTPEYVAPEIILNKGHDRAVDCWALGILMHELLTGAPPFGGPDPMKIYNQILKGIDLIEFPRHVGRPAQLLIKKLCRDAPTERLGCQRGGMNEIRKNKWFQGFDWDGLRQQTMAPPIVPQVRNHMDTSNFDHYTKDPHIPCDEDSNWDADF